MGTIINISAKDSYEETLKALKKLARSRAKEKKMRGE